MAQASDGIVVSAPVIRDPDQPRNAANPRTRLVANVIVETHDLDLRTVYGRSLLDRRIRVAADAACDQLDAIEPPSGIGGAPGPDSGDCRHLARKNAQPLVRQAIWAAG